MPSNRVLWDAPGGAPATPQACGPGGDSAQVEPSSWASPTSTVCGPPVSPPLWVFHLSQACPLPSGPSSPDRPTVSAHTNPLRIGWPTSLTVTTPWGWLQPLESLSLLGSAPASTPVLEHVAFWSQGRTGLLQRNLPGGDSATFEPLAQLLSLRKTSGKCPQWGLPQWSFG